MDGPFAYNIVIYARGRQQVPRGPRWTCGGRAGSAPTFAFGAATAYGACRRAISRFPERCRAPALPTAHQGNRNGVHMKTLIDRLRAALDRWTDRLMPQPVPVPIPVPVTAGRRG